MKRFEFDISGIIYCLIVQAWTSEPTISMQAARNPLSLYKASLPLPWSILWNPCHPSWLHVQLNWLDSFNVVKSKNHFKKVTGERKLTAEHCTSKPAHARTKVRAEHDTSMRCVDHNLPEPTKRSTPDLKCYWSTVSIYKEKKHPQCQIGLNWEVQWCGLVTSQV